MSKRLTRGTCGLKMNGKGVSIKGKEYLYCRCPATEHKSEHARDCNAPGFRADHVDDAVWEWVRSFLTDPEALVHGLREYQKERDKGSEPLRQRLAVVNDLMASNQTQLQRLLDLYLSGDLPKEMLIDRKVRLEATIAALGKERAGLVAYLEAHTLTNDQTQNTRDFVTEVLEGIQASEDDFETRRRVIEELDIQITLAVEDGHKVVYARCIVGEDGVLSLHRTPTVV